MDEHHPQNQDNSDDVEKREGERGGDHGYCTYESQWHVEEKHQQDAQKGVAPSYFLGTPADPPSLAAHEPNREERI